MQYGAVSRVQSEDKLPPMAQECRGGVCGVLVPPLHHLLHLRIDEARRIARRQPVQQVQKPRPSGVALRKPLL